MKKLKTISLLSLSALLLVACSESATENETEGVTETNEVQSSEIIPEENVETEESITEDVSSGIIYEYNEVIADNDNFKATLLEIEYIYDELWDEEKIEIRFDVENKLEDSIEVQARSLSINDRMVDDSIQMMSQEVAPGKIAEAVLTLQDYEGNDLPALEGNLEMLLHIFSWDNMDYEEDAAVSVSFE
ncbi:hypothetical protein [Jeotgalibaca sp. A127]|uniref:hypothetical protein n=1 Tax=Jeotgalibaca sp. A127 TaxID=3457324 RepID=UPI003FD0396A